MSLQGVVRRGEEWPGAVPAWRRRAGPGMAWQGI